MVITSREDVEKALKSVGFYRLRGYSFHLYDNATKKYVPGTKFEDILRLYQFDQELSSLIFLMISKIEVALRVRLVEALLIHGEPLVLQDSSIFKEKKLYWQNMSNGDLIYDEYITRKKRIKEDNLVVTVQANVINHFIENGGEILFGAKLKVPAKPIRLDKTVISKLRRELNQTYNSRNQTVIRWMIEYIQGLSVSSDSDKNGKWKYAIIASTLWESMILSVYGNQYPNDKTKYGKKYTFYSFSQGKDVIKGSPTQHDVIYEDDNQVIIIDAKMYGNPKNLLSEEVLGKQFGYYVEAKKKNPNKRIINILFAPTIIEKGERDGFADLVITDPHIEESTDPDRIIFLYRCTANQLINDIYFSKRKHEKLVDEFNQFICEPNVRQFLDARGTSY